MLTWQIQTTNQPTNPTTSQVAIKAPWCVIRTRPRVVRWSLCYLRRRWHFHFLRSLPPPNLLEFFFIIIKKKKKVSLNYESIELHCPIFIWSLYLKKVIFLFPALSFDIKQMKTEFYVFLKWKAKNHMHFILGIVVVLAFSYYNFLEFACITVSYWRL